MSGFFGTRRTWRGIAAGAAVVLSLGGGGCGAERSLEQSDDGPGASSPGTSSADGGNPGHPTPAGDAGGATYSPDAASPPQTLVVNKVDLLFMIDNSASMGDKQAYVETAIPELITRLTTPNCLDASGTVTGVASSDGSCVSGVAEFPPIHDMHIGIVSSSLGPRLGDQTSEGASAGVCLSSALVNVDGMSIPAHNDDQAHLLTRASTPSTEPATTALPDAPEGFLHWFPTVAANSGVSAGAGAPSVTSPATLETDFSDLVAGVQQYGCGIESQLESWYRFLVQPDPYSSLSLSSTEQAQWLGVDSAILQERHDFLRPDSLVAIVDLSDENDSEIDVRSVGGQGFYFMSFGFNPPRGTVPCNSNPADPLCVSCANASAPAGDANCALGAYSSPTDWGFDMNLRHVHMKAKYGLDPQYPLSRYVNGLTSTKVPDRAGEYPAGASSYVGTNDCTNPLYAASLPDGTSTDAATLCNLAPGARTPGLVFFLHIGGVPHQLLQDAQGATKASLTSADWVKILGNDPESYDYSGIDPHMVESQTPRNGTSADPNGVLAAPSAANGTDPISGREWITNVGAHVDLNVDREYACIFPLTTPRDCTIADNKLACDCSTAPGTLTPEETSPVCDATLVTQQDYAKAYPTTRELLLAKKLGSQGIVSSICPIDVVDNATADDPNYGYRPAISSLVSRIRGALAFSGN